MVNLIYRKLIILLNRRAFYRKKVWILKAIRFFSIFRLIGNPSNFRLIGKKRYKIIPRT